MIGFSDSDKMYQDKKGLAKYPAAQYDWLLWQKQVGNNFVTTKAQPLTIYNANGKFGNDYPLIDLSHCTTLDQIISAISEIEVCPGEGASPYPLENLLCSFNYEVTCTVLTGPDKPVFKRRLGEDHPGPLYSAHAAEGASVPSTPAV